MLPVYNEDKSQEVCLYYSPALLIELIDIYYWIGDFDKVNGRFIPDAVLVINLDYLIMETMSLLVLQDLLIQKQVKQLSFNNADQRLPGHVASSGWANCVGLQEIYLNEDGSDLKIKPVEAIKN